PRSLNCSSKTRNPTSEIRNPSFDTIATTMRLYLILTMASVTAAAQSGLPGAAPLTAKGDLALQMVDAINADLLQRTSDAAVRRGVSGAGLLLQPDGPPVARVVALSDADQTPEMAVGLAPGVEREAQFARRLAESGCQVLIPTLIDRRDTWSGSPEIRMTNQP